MTEDGADHRRAEIVTVAIRNIDNLPCSNG